MTKHFFTLTLIYTIVLIFSGKALSKTFNLDEGWVIQSSERVNSTGQVISSVGFDVKSWYPASVPSTIMGTLVKNNVYVDIFMGKNLESVPREKFMKSWWYRTEFTVPQIAHMKNIILQFDGINYRANVWLNGKKIATSDELFGVYRRFQFNVSKYVRAGEKNILAVEVFPPQPGEPSIGFVDWNPTPPDNNMGIWREVKLKITGDVSLNFPFVQSKIELEEFKSADLVVSFEVKNNSNKKINGILYGKIGSIEFSKKIQLDANENRLVTFTPDEFDQLRIINPRIWWVHNWGKPELYDLELNFIIDKNVSDSIKTQFGIREISDYINEQGHRGYKLNGKKILITGGGWVDHLFLDQSYKNLETQVQYVKHMGLNTIRMEGIWGSNEDLYNLCDKYGILLMVGWSCQWEWEGYIGQPADDFGAIDTPSEIELITSSWRDQIKWLRNHPSIFVWVAASDKLPRPILEKKYLKILETEDPSRPYLSSTHQGVSEVTGPSAVKMNGPYEYVPPMYWSTDTENGGAFGFNTETGPGPQIPPLENIKKMIPPNHLWPIDSIWYYHCGRHEFNTLDVYNLAINNRLGKPDNLREYVTKAQCMNYDGMRAMFEAFTANKPVTTGIIQWMLNASWPKLWWQLYDYYLMPNGAFYGAKKALEPVHIQYDYKNNAVVVVNNTLNQYDYYKAKAVLLNNDVFTSQKFVKEEYVSIKPNEAKQLFTLPFPEDIDGLTTTYFVALKLYNNAREEVSSNFYCLSVERDVLDTAKTEWYYTPTKTYADLTALNELEKIEMYHMVDKENEHKLNYDYEISFEEENGRIDIMFINESGRIALQLELTITKGIGGESVIPIFWDENYFSLLPGEKRTITGYFNKGDLHGLKPVLKISGWNVK